MSQYIKRLAYTRNEDVSFQTLIIDIVNKRSYFKIFLLATSNYGRNIQENINPIFIGQGGGGAGIWPPLWFFKDISICETFFLPILACKLVLTMYLYFWKVLKSNPP